MDKFSNKEDVSVVICGEAGQGIDTITNILTTAFKLDNLNIFSAKEYMSRVRGGNNSTELRISSKPVAAFVNKIDILIAFNKSDIEHIKARITSKTILFTEKENIDANLLNKCAIIDIPFSQLAIENGGKIFTNIIAAGLITGVLNLSETNIEKSIKKQFSTKTEEVIKKNIAAANIGYTIGKDLVKKEKVELKLNLVPNDAIKQQIVLTGNEAIALGCVAGGCNFIASYPMSPGTGVLTQLAKYSETFDILVEQVEDEISAINMSIGAWYAGARAMVTTSGGGFVLMEEGISLAGMIESPIVIHLAQRPGPATGLPTRMEQGDLELALYSGHGEFPRAIYAPGSLEQAFYIAQKAFNTADKYQIPVFILTDQYFLDSHYNTPSFNLDKIQVESHIVKTDKNYKRFLLTNDGISPRGIPDYGEGLVSVDSDEHTEDGHITEDLNLRIAMNNKRIKKAVAIKDDTLSPELVGNNDYNTLIVAWGSNYHIIKEALANYHKKDISLLHFSQVYPLHKDTIKYLQNAKTTIIVENNASSQFGKLIKLDTGFEIQHKILKYNGMPFSIEEIQEQLDTILEGAQ